MPKPDGNTIATTRDGSDFEEQIAPYRGELQAHCYRMLGSLHDAEDAMQEVMVRAWRGLERFEGRSSLRSWLYTIATNTCLNVLSGKQRRVLPVDLGPATDAASGPGAPLVESVWLGPYPDEQLGAETGLPGPDARYEQRESVELAFVAAVQHLPANQRAALIMREVLGFSAAETAGALETSVASVNSALQRARRTLDEHAPERSQQETLRGLGDDRVRTIVRDYTEAMQNEDVDGVIALLAQEAAWSMPPLASWFGPSHAEVRTFLANGPLSGKWTWRRVATSANGQPAIAAYTRPVGEDGPHRAFALDVLTLDAEGRITEVTAFIDRLVDPDGDDAFHARYPDAAAEPGAKLVDFAAFGLPETVD